MLQILNRIPFLSSEQHQRIEIWTIQSVFYIDVYWFWCFPLLAWSESLSSERVSSCSTDAQLDWDLVTKNFSSMSCLNCSHMLWQPKTSEPWHYSTGAQIVPHADEIELHLHSDVLKYWNLNHFCGCHDSVMDTPSGLQHARDINGFINDECRDSCFPPYLYTYTSMNYYSPDPAVFFSSQLQ